MRTLFLTAKKCAIDNKDPLITIEHLKEALSSLEFVDTEAKTLVYDYLKVKPDISAMYSLENLNSASESKKLDFDESVKLFKKHLESNGFSLSKRATKLFVKKQNT